MEIIQLLVQTIKLDVNVPCIDYALLVQCVFNCNGNEIAHYLIEKGANVNYEAEEDDITVLEDVQNHIKYHPPQSDERKLKEIESLLIEFGTK